MNQLQTLKAIGLPFGFSSFFDGKSFMGNEEFVFFDAEGMIDG